MLLLPLSRLGVLMSEDEVDLVGGSTLVGTKHDREGGLEVSFTFVFSEAVYSGSPCRCTLIRPGVHLPLSEA